MTKEEVIASATELHLDELAQKGLGAEIVPVVPSNSWFKVLAREEDIIGVYPSIINSRRYEALTDIFNYISHAVMVKSIREYRANIRVIVPISPTSSLNMVMKHYLCVFN